MSLLHWFVLAGAIGVIWFFIWMTFTYDRPSDHPRISIKEREYIESTIGEGQDKRQRVCFAHLQPAVHNYIIISFIIVCYC